MSQLPTILRLSIPALAAFLSLGASAAESESKTEVKPETSLETASAPASPEEEKKQCLETLNLVVRDGNKDRLRTFCDRVQRLPACQSTQGRAIHHADALSNDARGKRVLVLGMIHGDEALAGEMALEWSDRLTKLTGFRNQWRVVPMLNPDGLRLKTRMNARGVDLNRNFPTKDWGDEALQFWKKKAAEDPRRFPGDTAASEAETKCAIAQIKDFKPDFIVSVHTPYKVLDFDGPKMGFPAYRDLPWKALGNFPGSLGRFMWRDYQVPVLTVELGDSMVDAAKLQDIVGTFAIDAARLSGRKTASTFDLIQYQ